VERLAALSVPPRPAPGRTIERVGGWIDLEETSTVTSGSEHAERAATTATGSFSRTTATPAASASANRARRGSLSRVIDALACPVCGEAIAVNDDETALTCAAGHGFDVAKQGYVSLLRGGGNASTGDNADMVAARDALLGRGHYERIADAVARALAPVPSSGVGEDADADADAEAEAPARAPAPAPVSRQGLVVDLAGGTGYYLDRVLRTHPEMRGIDIDLSKFAARRAARRGASDGDVPSPTLAAIVADVWQPLPLQTGVAAAILSIFGPRNRPEILRVLQPGGRLVVVTPTARHLRELVGPLGMIGVDDRKQERLAAQLDGFTDLSSIVVEYETSMSHADVLNDVLMGPSAHHVDEDVLAERVAQLPEPVSVTVSVTVTTAFAPRRNRLLGAGPTLEG
jgi:23S rRNA (guanine745-N1)-methyltransferase